jgi:hypothetical protein
MLAATLLAAVVALGPSTDLAIPDFATHLDRAEVVGGGEDFQVIVKEWKDKSCF